jgi:pantoate--beta-alanine ligase
MIVISTTTKIRQYIFEEKMAGKTIGFVPTMGALHQGHLSLIKQSKVENDLTVCSIFVNPTQFNNPHDLAVYPRTLDSDCLMLDLVGCDVVFTPSVEDMYPMPTLLKFDFGNLERVMEGAFRAGHFNGVGIVVSKLFHLVAPHQVYFGQKDLQQCLVVRRLINDLSFDLTFNICPTVRESDGLAMSSRNRNLTPSLRTTAPIIYKTLCQAKEYLATQTVEEVKYYVSQQFEGLPDIALEYFEVADIETLSPLTGNVSVQSFALCIAAFFGKTRLIDNIVVN